MEKNIQELGKDPNFLILNQLDDQKLVLICQTNKFYQKICNDQIFWMNRVLNKFANVPIDIEQLRKYKGSKIDNKTGELRDRTWSEYYIEDVRIINENNAQDYLEQAFGKGRLDQIILAFLSGGNIRAREFWAVIAAANNGHLDVVKYLVSSGADFRARDDEAMIGAAKNGHLDVVKYLVSLGADFRNRKNLAVRLAARHGQSDVVDYLVSLGAPDPR